MNHMAHAYSETYLIADVEFKGGDVKGGVVKIPYTDLPKIELGDVVYKKAGSGRIGYVVEDISKGVTLGVGTQHANLLVLKVKSESELKKETGMQNISIASVTGENIQFGHGNTIVQTITIEDLVREIAKSDDPEAKSKLRSFLESPAAKIVLGAGVSVLLSLLGG